jgi:Flp pilus assembly protein TadD
MVAKGPSLDVEELLMLATRATQRGDTRKALSTLQRALAKAPDNAQAHLLLGGLQASAGRIDQALRFMTRAVELEPGFAAARFQLGLLHLTSGDVAQAENIWQPLQQLAEDNPYRLFKQGMLHLVRDEFADCVANIEAGIEHNHENKALNREMARIAERARRARSPDNRLPQA